MKFTKRILLMMTFFLIFPVSFTFAGLGLGGKFSSDFSYLSTRSGDAGLLDGLSDIPHVTKLAVAGMGKKGIHNDGRKYPWIPWGGGMSFAVGNMRGRPFEFELLFGRSPRDDLQMRFAVDWHLLKLLSLGGDSEEPWFQFFLGVGWGLTTYFDTVDDDTYDSWDQITSLRIPLGFKIFFLEYFEIFAEFVPQVGWHYSSIELEVEDNLKKNAQGFVHSSSNGTFVTLNHLQTGVSASLGIRYWLF